ncbi:MAG: hypothetical protein ANABAC_1705 [Anaerolineae bacterium]|jgi:hypothetical protein|nr:MAG: hypothetical protein ANABAC_1705 [Anaerolineae bacterium]
MDCAQRKLPMSAIQGVFWKSVMDFIVWHGMDKAAVRISGSAAGSQTGDNSKRTVRLA